MNAIELNGVWKKFRKGEKFDSLRDIIPNMVKRLFLSSWKKSNGLEGKEFWALKDVSFEVNKGNVLGIIGSNGAGKSTILKLLSKIMKPTKGNIKINGRLSALIEVGAGFHEDLTGRENIYLNGAIMGMKKWEINDKFDEIVEFSETSEFIDTPVKRYSSGMYARLGFSVAAHMNPDILLVDEVLSVGDICFQAKCLEKIKMMKASGVTIVFISHNMEAVHSICDRTILLHQSCVLADGETDSVIQQYHNSLHSKEAERDSQGAGNVITIRNVSFIDSDGLERNAINMGDNLIIRIELGSKVPVSNPVLGIAFYDSKGVCIYGHNSKVDKYSIGDVGGNVIVESEYNNINFQPGAYSVTVGIFDKRGIVCYEVKERSYRFSIIGDNSGEIGIVRVPHNWRVDEKITI